MKTDRGREEVSQLTTAVEIASELGVHRLTISRIARTKKIGRLIGSTKVFTKSEALQIKKICKVSKGNPNFGKKMKKL
jgi:hypothetical protein